MAFNQFLKLPSRTLDLRRPLVMGIVNATPDSFSDGGSYAAPGPGFNVDLDALVDAGQKMLRDGAALLDVGGESTRPGAEPVDEAEELRRVIPAIKALKERLGAILSVDTYRPSVAEEALDAGAEIVNDIAAGRYISSENRFAEENEEGFREEIAEIAARRKAAVVLMHMRGTPKTMQVGEPTYERGVVAETFEFLQRRRDAFLNAGVELEQIAFDPGFGFGKTFEQNWTLMRELSTFSELGGVLFVGDSRKRFLAESAMRFNDERDAGVLNPNSVGTRDFATALTSAFMARQGAQIIRVHNVAATRFALDLADRARELPPTRARYKKDY